MTVIVWDGKTMAADRLCDYNGTLYETTKIFRVPEGLLGLAGDAGQANAIRQWFEKGGDYDSYPKAEDDQKAYALHVTNSGEVRGYFSSVAPTYTLFENSQVAIGCGKDYAKAAMYLGKSAKEAVAVAIALDSGCGGGIDTIDLDVSPTAVPPTAEVGARPFINRYLIEDTLGIKALVEIEDGQQMTLQYSDANVVVHLNSMQVLKYMDRLPVNFDSNEWVATNCESIDHLPVAILTEVDGELSYRANNNFMCTLPSPEYLETYIVQDNKGNLAKINVRTPSGLPVSITQAARVILWLETNNLLKYRPSIITDGAPPRAQDWVQSLGVDIEDIPFAYPVATRGILAGPSLAYEVKSSGFYCGLYSERG